MTEQTDRRIDLESATLVNVPPRELAFREAFLACFPQRMATVLRALGGWMYDQAVASGLVEISSSPRSLLHVARQDLDAVRAVFAEISTSDEAATEQTGPDVVHAARVFHVEVCDLLSRIDAVLAEDRPAVTTIFGSQGRRS